MFPLCSNLKSLNCTSLKKVSMNSSDEYELITQTSNNINKQTNNVDVNQIETKTNLLVALSDNKMKINNWKISILNTNTLNSSNKTSSTKSLFVRFISKKLLNGFSKYKKIVFYVVLFLYHMEMELLFL